LEDMVASHQRYSVPDSGLRDEMRQKVKEMIQPHYSVFRKTFIKKEFTTKVNKYIKYSEETMEEEIDKIFDPEA
jgi:exocyst complex protein 7